MASVAEGAATHLVQRLIDGAIREVNYLCCFKTHVGNFEKKREQLVAKKTGVEKDIADAKTRNETQVEQEVEYWLKETNGIIVEDTKTNMKCFHGWYPTCIWQYKQGRKLAKKIQDITSLIERCNNFNRVARPAQRPGIKYYSPQNFIDFDSRKLKFQKLVDILQDGNYYMIGLHGLGGIGKTTLATKLGNQVEESQAFQKVIFAVVSNPPNISKIRQKIASQLELKLEQEKEEDHSEFLWARIANYEGKVLIILDDIWEWLDLRAIGIPYGPNHRNCSVLITTSDLRVCEAMGCQETITLQTLSDDDAFNLFIQQINKRNDGSSNEFNEDLARGIAKECGGIPLAIVAVATTIKGWSLPDWKNALETLRNSNPLSNIHDELEDKVYTILKLSYDRLKEKAKYLLLLCSLFPEDYEIPIDLLSKLAIGSDLFRESDNYSEARRKVVPIKNDLIKSSLLLEGDEVCVKMHDLVRKVALWIAKENVQVVMNSSRTLKSNLKFLFWSNEDFPNCFEAIKLEILIICIDGEAKVRDPTIFEGMTNLKVLFLEGPFFSRLSFTPSLQSLLPLKSIRTLIFSSWKLGDISILKNLECLETFELEYCSITELPKEISELKKLKLLGLRNCDIERNNPFKVIEICPQLEELYFVENDDVKDWKLAEDTNEVSQDRCPLLKRYSIACPDFEYFDDNGFSNCFNTKNARELISKSLYKNLIEGSEVLEFWGTEKAELKSIVGGVMMNDLIKLCLCDLADTDVPLGSFKKLQVLKLLNCEKLQHLCFDGNLKLPHLKSLGLKNCPMLQPSIFEPSVALCVEQLEELIIEDCKALTSLITYEGLGVDQQKSYGSPFQKLKTLKIKRCGKLELVSPLFSAGDLVFLEDLCIRNCEVMKYIFGEYRYEGQALHQDSILRSLAKIELREVPSFIDIFPECKISAQRSCPILKEDSKEKHAMSFSRASGCCFLPTTKDIDFGVSNSSLQNLEATKESSASSKRLETFQAAQLLSLKNIKEMTLHGCLKVKSLFSVSIATTIMLETLEIWDCKELKDIIINDDHPNCTSIFPKLQSLQIYFCNNLEFIFPSTLSGGLQKLKSIHIFGAHELKHVFGAYNNDPNINVVPIDLPALEILSLEAIPKIISLCASNYYVARSSLQRITMRHSPGMTSYCSPETEKGLIARSSFFPDFMICLQPRQPNMETSKDYIMKIIKVMQNLISLKVGYCQTIQEIFNVEGIQSKGPVALSLEEMQLKDLGELRQIYKDPNNILSLLNLKVLQIHGCHKLRALFTTSTEKILPRLSILGVHFCTELVHIIEEDDYETSAYGRPHQLCFPMLESIHIDSCHGMRSLFWISTKSTTLPKLKTLKIIRASRLEEVFRCQQNDTQEMSIQNLFPNLSKLKLMYLPELRTICQGINFHSVPKLQVADCPNYIGHKEFDSGNKSPTEELQATHSNTNQAMTNMGEAKREQEIEAQELTTSASTYLTGNFKEAMEDIIQEVPVSKSAMELESGHIMRESTVQLQQWPLGETKTIVNASHKTNTPFDDDNSIDVMLKECDQEGPILEDVVIATLPADFAYKNSLDLMKAESRGETTMPYQQELGEMTISVGKSFLKDSAIMKSSIVTSSIYSQARSSQSGTSELNYKEIDKGDGKVVPASKLPATTSPDFERLINGQQPRTEKNLADQLNSIEATSEIEVPHQTNIPIMKEAVEQSFQEHDGSKKGITPTNSNKGFYHSLERGKEVVGIASASTSTAALSNSKSSETQKEAVGMLLTSGLSMATTSSKLEDLMKMELRSKIIMTQQQELEKMTTDSIIESIPEDTTTMKGKISTPPIYSQAEGLQSDPPAQVTPSIEGTLEQGPQQNYATEEDKTANKSIDLDSEEQLRLVGLLEIENAQSPNEASKDISEKVSASGGASDSILFDSEFTKKETRNASVLKGHKAEKAANLSTHSQSSSPNPTKDNRVVADVIPPLHHQPQIGVAGSSSPTLEIGEIFQLVELKEGEPALLANALERYPQLRLPREQRTNRIIALSYRVLVDILVMLTTMTPCTITASDRSIIEDNLGEATILGFNNEWIESVRAKISGSDTLDVSSAEKEIIDMEAKLETCEIALDDVHKQRAEAKEWLEAIDSQLLGLLADRKKLVLRMAEIRDLTSSKDKPFGF